MKTWSIAFAQCRGKGKARCQDALFDGDKVYQEQRVQQCRQQAAPLRLGVADGVYCSPGAHVASAFWMHALANLLALTPAHLRAQHRQFAVEVGGRYPGAATTFAAVELAADGCGRLLNIGDSRIYRITPAGSWLQISHDHTLLAELIASGVASPDQDYAACYDDLAECLIADPMEDDFVVFNADYSLQAGEALLLCSDGLSDALTLEVCEEYWRQAATPDKAIYALCRAVGQKARHDDLSLVCIW